MKLSADEFLSLSTQLSDRDVKAAELELQLQETKEQLMIKEAENMALTQRLTELEQINTATELDELNNANETEKFFRDGQMLIRKNGNVYTPLGVRVE